MAFVVGYMFSPKQFLIQTASLLRFMRATIYYSIFSFLDLISQFLHSQPSNVQENPTQKPINPPATAILIRELLPVIDFSESLPNSISRAFQGRREWQKICPVCLYEFESSSNSSGGGDDDITCLINCEHIFHKRCLDPWLDYDHETCPVCRKHLVPIELQKEFKDRLWEAFVNGEDIYCG